MQTKTFNVTKRGRKYFKATLPGGYPCRILIDVNSENLSLGLQDLLVEDLSVRTKYGSDLIYKLYTDVSNQTTSRICTLTTEINSILVERCRNLGGRWDAESSSWVFSSFLEDEVEELDAKYNSQKVVVELTAKDRIFASQSPIYAAGISIARAFGRDSGATLSNGIALITGEITSGGSVKNWGTVAEEGTIIRLQVPNALIPDIEEEGQWTIQLKE